LERAEQGPFPNIVWALLSFPFFLQPNLHRRPQSPEPLAQDADRRARNPSPCTLYPDPCACRPGQLRRGLAGQVARPAGGGGGAGGRGGPRGVEGHAGGGAGPPNRHRGWVLAGACRDARRRDEPSGGWPQQICPQQVNRSGGTDPCVGRGRPRPQVAAKTSDHLSIHHCDRGPLKTSVPHHSFSGATGEAGATMSTGVLAVRRWLSRRGGCQRSRARPRRRSGRRPTRRPWPCPRCTQTVGAAEGHMRVGWAPS
jgi:hypothetical protein